MADAVQFFPLFVRNEEQIRADMNVRVNAGVGPSDPEWTDTRPGGTFHLHTQPVVTEIAGVYDRMNELVAAAIISTSWGTFLDNHAATYGEKRLPATHAKATLTFTGIPDTVIPSGITAQPEQTDPDVETPVFATDDTAVIGVGGTIDVSATALEEGSFGNVSAGRINYVAGVAGVESVTNANPAAEGSDEETDAQLKKRLIQIFQGSKNGNKADYRRELMRKFPEIGYVTVFANTPDPGDVLIMVLDKERNPIADTTIYQMYLDPVPGQGDGWAPINHFVTVSTPNGINIYTVADIVFDSGYSLDGTGGTVGLREAITDAVVGYINSLPPGADVVFNNVEAVIFDVEGVHDVANVAIGTSASPTGVVNIAIGTGEVAQVASGGVVLEAVA